MLKWFIINDNVIIDIIVSDTKEFLEDVFKTEVIPNDGIMGIGWTRTENGWIPPYPTDGKEYILDSTFNRWVLKNPVIIEE